MLEFSFSNNTIEYEGLFQGLQREDDLKVKHINVYGDSNIVRKQARNTIH